MPVVEDVGATREREAGGDVLLDQHDGLALLRQLAAGPHQVLDDHRRQSLEGFVEQDDLRIAHQRPGDGEHLLLAPGDRKSTRLNSSHVKISYAVFCLKKKKNTKHTKPV